jgi:hypothetical protein
MKLFISYLRNFLRNSSAGSILSILIFIAVLTGFNYTFGIEKRIRAIHPWYLSLLSFFFFYGSVLFFSWGLQYSLGNKRAPGITAGGKRMMLLLLLAPLFFSFKMIHWDLSPLLPARWRYPWDHYALIVLQIPAKLLLLLIMLWACWKLEGSAEGGSLSFYGLTTRNFRAKPYFLILLCLVPLVALASTRPDFLHTYPKVKNIAFVGAYTKPVWPWQLLYEVSYGLDFLNIELFFRGFLVIGLARYAGEYAILPMAAFYCTIHFGKPLGECISSFFGGLALGVIALRSRTILGGLIVHLGLAWMMEIGGWLGLL